MVQIMLLNLIILSTFVFTNARHSIISQNAKASSIDKNAVEIFQRCFTNGSINTIGFIGESSSIFSLNMKLLNTIATIRFDNPETGQNDPEDRSTKFLYGLPFFVVNLSDKYSAKHLLLSLKKTRWWNHAGTFITLDKRIQIGNVSCIQSAREFLLTTWKMDILSSIFLCSNFTHGEQGRTFLYTYNSYGEVAPMPWKKVETRMSPEGHPWTLFEQAYDSVKTTCDCIKFRNKTLDLNGFKIPANVKPYPPFITLDAGRKSVDDLGGWDATILKAVWKKMNASVSMKIYNSKASFGDSFENGSAKGMMADLVSGECDINLNLRYIRKQWGVRFTLAQTTGGLSIVTNHRGWKSPLTKIADFVKFELILAVFLVCLVTIVVVGFSPSPYTLPDFMNLPRILLSTGMYHLPKSTPQRLLLFATMLMVLVINSAVQGKLAELLTSRMSRQQVETINDIEQFGYEIYGFQYLSEFIPLKLLDRFHDPKLYYIGFCSELLANHSKAACLAQRSDVSVLMAKQNLYISQAKFAIFHKAHTTRKSWPLYDRFNRLIERLVESGLARYWESGDEGPISRKMNTRSSEPSIRTLEYQDLRFAFKILAVGLTLSTVIFIIEYFFVSRVCRYTFSTLNKVVPNISGE